MSFLGKLGSKGVVGVDIGTASIKVAEMLRESGRFKLLNYGVYELESQEKIMQVQHKTPKLSDEYITAGLREIFRLARIPTRKVVASIPSFSTFTTIISLPYLSEKDLAKTIPFEAKKYIPAPLSEVAIDWSIIKVTPGGDQNRESGKTPPSVEVFLAAVPENEVTRYKQIILAAGLQLVALELENVALIRSLIGNDLEATAIVNIGGRSTSILIVERGYEAVSHNYEVGGFEITKSIARSMGVNVNRAEEIKKTVGMKTETMTAVSESMVSLLDMIIFETQKTIITFETSKNTKVPRLILTGGLANMPGLLKHFKTKMSIEVQLSNPFARVAYPQPLQSIISPLGSVMAVAVGLAMREI